MSDQHCRWRGWSAFACCCDTSTLLPVLASPPSACSVLCLLAHGCGGAWVQMSPWTTSNEHRWKQCVQLAVRHWVWSHWNIAPLRLWNIAGGTSEHVKDGMVHGKPLAIMTRFLHNSGSWNCNALRDHCSPHSQGVIVGSCVRVTSPKNDTSKVNCLHGCCNICKTNIPSGSALFSGTMRSGTTRASAFDHLPDLPGRFVCGKSTRNFNEQCSMKIQNEICWSGLFVQRAN